MSDSVWPQRGQPTRLPRPWDSPGQNTGVGCHFLFQCMKVKSESEVIQSCPTLLDPMDCSPPGSSVRGIFQARVLEWGAIAFSIISYRKVQSHYLDYQCTGFAKNQFNETLISLIFLCLAKETNGFIIPEDGVCVQCVCVRVCYNGIKLMLQISKFPNLAFPNWFISLSFQC